MAGYNVENAIGMYTQDGNITGSDYNYLYSEMSTKVGWSGGPLLENRECVVGIHKGRYGFLGYQARAIRITKEIFNIIVSYM